MHKIEKMLHNDNLYDEKFTEEEMVNVDAIQTLREQNQKMKAHINQALKAKAIF